MLVELMEEAIITLEGTEYIVGLDSPTEDPRTTSVVDLETITPVADGVVPELEAGVV